MDIARYILLIIEVICSFCLIVLIMVQKSKSEGLGLAFGSGMGETLFGSRAGNILTKLTIGFAIVFMVNTLFLSLLYSGRRGQSLMGRMMGSSRPAPTRAAPARPASETPSAPASGAPTFPGSDFSSDAATPVPFTPAASEPAPAE